MGLLGFLAAGAVSGAGEAAQKSLLEQQKDQAEQDKIKFAAQLKLQMEAAERKAQGDSLGNFQQGMIQKAQSGVNQTYDTAAQSLQDNADAIAANGGDVQSALDAVQANRQNALDAASNVKMGTDDYARWGAESGYVDAATKLGGLAQKNDALLYKALWEQSKEDGRNERADKRLDTMLQAIQMRIDAKEGSGGAKDMLGYLNNVRTAIGQEESNILKARDQELSLARPSEKQAIMDKYQTRLSDIEAQRNDLKAMQQKVGASLGVKGAPAQTPAPTPAPAASPAPANRPPLSSFIKP